jgi:hypothetical protein
MRNLGVNEMDEFLINIPVKWNITVERQPNGQYKLTYIETVEKPEYVSEEEFKRMVEGSVEIARETMKKMNINAEANLKFQDGKGIAEIQMIGELELAANIIVSEFLPFMKLGRMTLKDLLMYAIVGVFGMEKVMKAITLVPQPTEFKGEAVLIRDPEKISEKPEKWALYCSSKEEWLYLFVTREICPEIEELKKGGKVIVKMSGNEVVKVEKVKGSVGE